MRNIHKAAAIRAYRTLATGLGSSAVATAAVAAFTEGEDALLALGVAVGTTIVSAVSSFFLGIAAGLPEASEPSAPFAWDPDPDL